MNSYQKPLNLISLLLFVGIFGFCLWMAVQISPSKPAYFAVPVLLVGLFAIGARFVNPSRSFVTGCIWTIGAVGVLLRIYWAVGVGVEQTSDASYYILQGRKILEGRQWLDPYKQAGPEWMSALGLLMFGSESDRSALIPYLVANCLYLPLVYGISRCLFGATAAFFSLLLISFWPEHIFYSSFITAHIYQGFFLLLGVLLFLEHQKPGRSAKSAAFLLGFAGVALGISQYMRGSTMVFVFGFVVYLVITRIRLKILAVLLYGFMVVLLPALIFNYSNFKIFSISPSQNSGVSLVIGSNLKTKGHYYEGFQEEILTKRQEMAKAGDLILRSETAQDSNEQQAQLQWEINQAATRLAKERIQANPIEFAKIAVTYKMPVFWASGASLSWALEGTYLGQNPERRAQIEKTSDQIHQSLVLLCVLGFLFLLLDKNRSIDTTVLAAFVWGCLGLGAVHMLAEIQSQYHASVAGLFPILSGAAFPYAEKWVGLQIQRLHLKREKKRT